MANNLPPDLSKLALPPNAKEEPRTFDRSHLIWGGGGVVLGLLVGIALFGGGSSELEATAATPVAPVSSPSSIAPVVEQGNRVILNATGYVVAQRKAAVSSKATGRLKELRAREGTAVKQGEILGVLENDDLQAALAQAEANVRVAEAALAGALAQEHEARQEQLRFVALHKEGIVSNTERDAVDARAESTRAARVQAEASVELAKAQRDRAQVDLEFTYIRAPFDGTVLTKNADVGEVVAPFGSSANARAALVTIADMESLAVEADVSEANISKVTVGKRARITLDSFPEKFYEGEVTSIVPTVDRAKGTILTKIRFLERDERVIPEMSARVAFLE